MSKFDQNVFDLRRCNAVVKEVREVEKRVKNIVIFNVPDSKEKEEKDRGKEDERKVGMVLKELGFEAIQPKSIGRIGKSGGKYPQQILVILQTVDECEGIMKKYGEGVTLKDNVFITRDRTFNQRQEAKLFRTEQTLNGTAAQSETEGRGGRSRGRPRGGGAGGRGAGGKGAGGKGVGGRGGGGRGRGGGGRGGGGRGAMGNDFESRERKRNLSDESDEDEAKRQKTGRDGGETPSTSKGSRTPDRSTLKPAREHPATPHPVPDVELGAVGGVGTCSVTRLIILSE